MDLRLLQGPLVFISSFCVVCALCYIPSVSWIVEHVGKVVIVGVIGAAVSLAITKYVAGLFSDGQKAFVSSRGKAVFITGCDTGFGHDLALRLHELGFYVFAGCLNSDSGGGTALRLKGSVDGLLHVLQCDVTQANQVSKCAATVKSTLKKLELVLWAVVNNAGIATFSEFEWVPTDVYEKILDVNALGSVRVLKALLPSLRESAGRIIIVASLAGRYAIPGFTGYCMSKHAQIALADGLRRELKKFGITVCLIEPGAYKTNLAAELPGHREVDRHWETSEKEVKDFYGREYLDAFKKHLTKMADSANPAVLDPVKMMEQAVTAVVPELRYVPGHWFVRLRGFLLPCVPYFIQDFIMDKAALQMRCCHENSKK